MDYVKKVKEGNRLIYCSETHFANNLIFKKKVAELNEFLKEKEVNFKSTPGLDTKSDKYFVRVYGLRDVKLWDIAGIIK